MDRPILFSGPLVRAILAGTKRQTRRALRPNLQTAIRFHDCDEARDAVVLFVSDGHSGPGWYVHCSEYPEEGSTFLGACPYGEPGDRLWVRETWGWRVDAESRACIAFRADGSARSALAEDEGNGDFVGLGESAAPAVIGGECWRPSIFLPRWASRLTLAVESVLVERLQDISCADAIAEGVAPQANSISIDCDTPDPRESFRTLWDSINAARPGCSWQANPWVWCVKFAVAEVRR